MADAAASFVGVPFRLGGRDPAFGLDCVGLVAASLRAAGHECAAPCGYGLRNSSIARHLHFALEAGFREVQESFLPGDIILTTPGPAQHHLAIAFDAASFIHAHAGLRRVTRLSGPLPWPLIKHWRLP